MRRLRFSSHARALDALAQLTAGQPRLAGAKGHLRSACGVNGALHPQRWPARLAFCTVLLALAWPAAAHAGHSQLWTWDPEPVPVVDSQTDDLARLVTWWMVEEWNDTHPELPELVWQRAEDRGLERGPCVLPIERGIVVCTNPSWYPAAKSKSYTEIHREGPHQLVTAAVEDDRTTYHRLVTILRHELFGHAVAGLHHNVGEPCSLLRPSYDPCMGDFTAHDLDLMLGGYR